MPRRTIGAGALPVRAGRFRVLPAVKARQPQRVSTSGPPPREPEGCGGRTRQAELLLARLRESARPLAAAEELDRVLRSLESSEADAMSGRIRDLCRRWTAGELKGERARAWLALVGTLGLSEHRPTVARIAVGREHSAPVRCAACRALGALGVEGGELLARILCEPGDPDVREAAAEALATIGDRRWSAELSSLLAGDVPPRLWRAISDCLVRLETSRR